MKNMVTNKLPLINAFVSNRIEKAKENISKSKDKSIVTSYTEIKRNKNLKIIFNNCGVIFKVLACA